VTFGIGLGTCVTELGQFRDGLLRALGKLALQARGLGGGRTSPFLGRPRFFLGGGCALGLGTAFSRALISVASRLRCITT
jgi:hypothetical protein